MNLQVWTTAVSPFRQREAISLPLLSERLPAARQLLGLSNASTSAYPPQTNGQVERYNRTILNMLRCYVEEHQTDWDRYASALTYAYNNDVHRSTGTTPFQLVLSRPPPPFSLHRSLRQRPDPNKATRHEFLVNLDAAIQRAYVRLKKSQQRYKRDFDARVRRTNVDLKASDYVFIDSSRGQGKRQSSARPPQVRSASSRETNVPSQSTEVVIRNVFRVTASQGHRAQQTRQ